MSCVGGVFLRRIVLEINFREFALTLRQYFVLVNLVIFTVLKQYHVKVMILHLADRDIVHITPPLEPRQSAAVTFALSFR
jgi:hypothetical protein